MAEAKVTVRRLVLRQQDVMIATGDFDPIFRAWRRHADRWELEVDGLGEIMMHQALSGAALQLSFRVPEESTAWTMNFSDPPTNVFVTGGGIHHGLTGRYYPAGVEHVGHNRLFVQRAHPHKEVQRSALEVEGLDILDIFEQFHRDSEQRPARFLEHSATQYSMVIGLPDADDEWLMTLGPDEVTRLIDEASPLDQREFFFRCGCDPEQVAGTLARMFATQADEFFGGQSVIEAICPRCGARHLLDRKTFDRIVESL